MSKLKKKLESAVKKAQDKAKTEINKAADKVGGASTKVKAAVQKVTAGDAKDAAMLAPVIPFIPAMRAAIQKKGVTPRKAHEIKALTLQFGTVVLGIKPRNADTAGRSGADTKNGEVITTADVIVETGTAGLGVAAGAASAYGGDPNGFKLLIQSILNYFKFLKKKKDAGQKLSKAEEEALKIAESAADEISGMQKDAILENVQKFAIPVLVIAVVYFAFIKK